MDEERLESVRDRILARLQSGRLRLPGLPDVALRVREAVQDPDRGVADVARILQVDPALAARIVHIANSPLYRGERRIDSCHAAVTRLGLEVTRNLVVGFTLRGLLRPRRPALQAALQRQWQFSCRVAAVSTVLARLTPGVDADRVILAGLVHGIGALPVLAFFDREEEAPEGAQAEAVIERLQGELGRMVLAYWEFDEELCRVPLEIRRHERVAPDAEVSGPPGLFDVVQVAWVHARFGDPGGYDGPPLPELTSFRRLPLSRLGPDASLEVLEQSREEIRELLRILSG